MSSSQPGNGTQTSADQRRSNLRLGLILASVALVFFAGFMTKVVLFGR